MCKLSLEKVECFSGIAYYGQHTDRLLKLTSLIDYVTFSCYSDHDTQLDENVITCTLRRVLYVTQVYF